MRCSTASTTATGETCFVRIRRASVSASVRITASSTGGLLSQSGASRAAGARGPGPPRVHRERDRIEDHPVLAARELERDLLVADVLRHALRVAREGIAVAAAARLLVQHDVAAAEGDGELGGHLARLAVRVQHVARAARG